MALNMNATVAQVQNLPFVTRLCSDKPKSSLPVDTIDYSSADDEVTLDLNKVIEEIVVNI